MARIGQPITASPEETAELLTMKRSQKLERRYAERAEIILHSLEGKSLEQIVELTGKSRPVVMPLEAASLRPSLLSNVQWSLKKHVRHLRMDILTGRRNG
jgi:hypothetical protein